MNFTFHQDQPVVYEGWLQKANDNLIVRWQARYFRIQGRGLYYFKTENITDAPKGVIPLIDIRLEDLPKKKNTKCPFQIVLTKNLNTARRPCYKIDAPSDDVRDQWKKIIAENSAKSIVGEEFTVACTVTPKSIDTHRLIPFFMPPIFQQLEKKDHKTRGIWTSDVDEELIQKNLSLLDQNYMFDMGDIQTVVATLHSYMKQLPSPFLKAEDVQSPTAKKLRDAIQKCPAPVRQFIKMLGQHFHMALESSNSNYLTRRHIVPIIGPLLVSGSAQEQVANCFIDDTEEICDDIHSFQTLIKKQPPLYKARIIETIALNENDILDGPRGLLLDIVNEDSAGWCVVTTTNRKKIGLLHSTQIRKLTEQEIDELNAGPNIDEMMDDIRDNFPVVNLLIESMNAEIALIESCMQKIGKQPN